MEPPVSIWSQPPKGYGRIRPLSEQFMVQKKKTDGKSAPQTTPNDSNSERKITSGEIYKSYRNEVLVKTDPSLSECSLTFSITPVIKHESKELLKSELMRSNTERPLDLRISKENGNMFSVNLPKPVTANQTNGCQTECINNAVQTENVKLLSSDQNSLKVDVQQMAPLTCSITFPNQNSKREQNGCTLNNSVSNRMKYNSFTTLKLEVNHMSTKSENSVSIVDINQNPNFHLSYQSPNNEDPGIKLGIKETNSSPYNSSVNVEKVNKLDRRDDLIIHQENEVNRNLEVQGKFNESTIADCVSDATLPSLKLPDKTANKEMYEQKLPNKNGIKCEKTNTEKSINEIIHDINRRECYKRRLRRQRRLKVDIKRICSFLNMGFAATSTFGVCNKAYKRKRRKLLNTVPSRTKTKDSQIVKCNQLPSKKENTDTGLTKDIATKVHEDTYNNVECLKLLPPGIILSKITVEKRAKEWKQNNIYPTDIHSIDQECDHANNDQEQNHKHKESVKNISEHQTDHNQTLLIEEKQKNENNNLENVIETKLELNQEQVKKRAEFSQQLKACNRRKVRYRRKNNTYRTVLRKSPRLPANRQTYIAAYESSSEETNKSHKRKIKSSIKRKAKLPRSGKRFKQNNAYPEKEDTCIIIIDSSEEDESDNINQKNKINTVTDMNRNRDSVIKLNAQSKIPIESEDNPDDIISNIMNTNKESVLPSTTKHQDVQLPGASVIDEDTFLPKYLKKLHKYPLPVQTPTHQPNYNFPNQITDVTVPIINKTSNSKTALNCHKRVLRDPRRKSLNIEDFRVNGPQNIPTFEKTNFCSEEKQKDFEKNTLLVKQILRQATGYNEIRSDENGATNPKSKSLNEKLKDFNDSTPPRWRSLRNVRKFKPPSEALNSPETESSEQGLKIRIFKENRSHKVQIL